MAADRSVACRLVVRGSVQGVFFRASAKEQADRWGVVGWAANQGDGSVELWLEGSPDAVDRIRSWVGDGGPPAARVESVEMVDEQPGGLRDFRIRSG